MRLGLPGVVRVNQRLGGCDHAAGGREPVEVGEANPAPGEQQPAGFGGRGGPVEPVPALPGARHLNEPPAAPSPPRGRASYYAGDPSVASCTSGDARIWGMDFVNPYTVSGAGCAGNTDPACRANGGVYSADVAADVGYVDVGTTNPGVVVPGVAVQETPACGSVSASTFAGGDRTRQSARSGTRRSRFSSSGCSRAR